ncbi:branched-chain amino acid ABC transporter substrate-binding protein [Herbaspirillum sp. LeCh32-8]|uniref:branched-chain amino acid ABC transporter substrate-binding protein n=1 Tax=Herbaspirillum sp. LeCh32-8 TaxID=2821356 RepID=UPI001AE81FFA|nr:branched-chain amino acid ABC transporter substrate-binding protein [Herbaspirillum sp. LeCh32-8]MBP0599949.1 branched-chain amino acid ABC transporter substrate-binding protein [Herbaspirillum sp. LeCh32-8]
MNIAKKLTALIWLSLLCVSAIANDTPQVVLIGLPANLKASKLDSSVRDAAQLAVDDANKTSIRINGKPVLFQLLSVEDKSDANFAVVAANHFIRMRVVGVIGHNNTDTSRATSGLYENAGIPQITPSATGSILTESGYKTIFQLLGGSNQTAKYLAEIVAHLLPGKRIAVIDNGTVLGTGLATMFIQRLREQGIEITARESVSPKLTGLDNLVANLKAQSIDVIFFTGFGSQATEFSRSIKQVNSPAQLLVTGGAINEEFPDAGKYAEGTLILLHGSPTDKLPGYKAFEKRYRERFDTPISAYTLFAYDATSVLIAAIKKADSLVPSAIGDTLHSIQYKGVSGPISFAADGRQNSPPYTLYQVSQGKWRAIKIFDSN